MALSPDHGRIFAATLHGIFIISVSILFILGLRLGARRHSDPARCGLPWLRAVFIFAIAGATLTTLSYALTLHLSSTSLTFTPATPPSSIARLLRTTEAALYVSTVGTLLSLLSDIFLLVTLVSLSRGFILSQKPRAARLAHRASLAGAAVLGVLALVAFGLAVRYNRGVLAMARGEEYPPSKVGRDTLAVGRVSAVVDVVVWVGSVGVLGWVGWGVVKGVREGVRKAVRLVLAAAVVTSLRALGLMVLAAIYGFDITTLVAPEVVFIVRPVVDLVPLLLILGLLFVVSIRKEGGLWSAGAVGQTSWLSRGGQDGGQYAPGETGRYYKSHEMS